MKTKTIIELLTLSSSIYVLAKETNLLDRINEYSEKGKDGINKILSESQLDENGNELDFADKIILKTHELKEELYEKIEELVIQFYKKINVAHTDEIKALNEKLEQCNTAIALLEARLNKLETQ
jgi:polyhydroxyalkanoate synthesis regulator phasin